MIRNVVGNVIDCLILAALMNGSFIFDRSQLRVVSDKVNKIVDDFHLDQGFVAAAAVGKFSL